MSIRVGVIGYGYWGPNLARNFAECPATTLAAVADQRPERLVLAGRSYPGVRLCSDWRELVADPTVDAVAVATPVGTHAAMAQAALEAGKHVLVEKPITARSSDGEELIEIAARKGRTLMVDHTFAYTGAVRKIRELVASDQLGKIYYYDSVRVNLGLFQSDVNVLWDLAVHDLAILDYVLDARPVAVSANGMSHFPGCPENVAYLTLYFASDLIAHIHSNWLAPVKIRGTLVSGSKKMVVYNDIEPSEKIRVYDTGVTMKPDSERYRLLVDYRAGDMWAPQFDRSEALKTEVAHFADCIATGKRPITDGECGLRIVRILEAASRSMASRGAPVELGREGWP
jgi:predicted dehydrogenase